MEVPKNGKPLPSLENTKSFEMAVAAAAWKATHTGAREGGRGGGALKFIPVKEAAVKGCIGRGMHIHLVYLATTPTKALLTPILHTNGHRKVLKCEVGCPRSGH